MTSSEPLALQLEAVCKSFGGLRAVDRVELAVRPGERRALIGPNGAGKTTLFNLIAGALPVTSGRITLFGADVTGKAQHRRAALGLARTFQITNLFPALTVRQNALLAAQALTRAKFAMLRPLERFTDLEARAGRGAGRRGPGRPRRRHRAPPLARRAAPAGDRPGAGRAAARAAARRAGGGPVAGRGPAHDRACCAASIPPSRCSSSSTTWTSRCEVAQQVTVLHYGRVIADGPRETVKADPTVREIYLGA